MKRFFKLFGVALLVFFITAIAVLYLRPSQIRASEEVREQFKHPTSHFISWRNATVHYTDEGSGPTLLLIHGFGGSYKNYDSLALLMKDRYRVIRVDLPGFGLSDFPALKEGESHTDAYRDYFTFLLDALKLDSVLVVGNSMGGGMSWMLAGDHPDKVQKIVLLNSAGYDVEKVAAKLIMFRFKSVKAIFERGMPLFTSMAGLKTCYADKNRVDENVVKINNVITNREGNIKHMMNLADGARFPDTALIKRVQCPTLIVWGQQDEIVPVDHAYRFKRDIANSELVILDPCGHVPMMELPTATADTIHAFFKQ